MIYLDPNTDKRDAIDRVQGIVAQVLFDGVVYAIEQIRKAGHDRSADPGGAKPGRGALDFLRRAEADFTRALQGDGPTLRY